MKDEEFDACMKAGKFSLEQFKELYDITVYDLKHAIRHRDADAIEKVAKYFDGELRSVLNKVSVGE